MMWLWFSIVVLLMAPSKILSSNFNALKKRNKSSRCSLPQHKVYVATAGTSKIWKGLLTAVHSIFRHSSYANCIDVTIFTPMTSLDDKVFNQRLESCFKVRDGNVNIFPVSLSNFSLSSTVYGYPHLLNMIRFYIPALIPHADKILWIDADVLILGDVYTLISNSFQNNPGAAIKVDNNVDNTKKNLYQIFDNYDVGPHLNKINISVDINKKGFNAGIMLMNLKIWRIHNFTQRIEKTILDLRTINMTQYHGMSTFESSQMPLIYIFNFDGNWIESLPTKWNICSLGWKANIPNKTFEKAEALHWTGKKKPWKTNKFEKNFWWNKMFWWKEYDENSKLLPRICSAVDKSNPRRW